MLRFPTQKDVRLQRAPLTEVICQVRFPPILRIAKEEPVDFQEQVRREFPQLEVGHGILVRMSSEGISPPSPEPRSPVFRFKSRDGNATVSLAPGFYALSTTAYTHWDDFVKPLQLVSEAVRAAYELPYATRIGLRYINHLTLENTGVDSTTDLWNVLRPELTVLLRVDCWDEPLEMLNQLLLAGEEDERLTLRAGLKRGEENKPLFLLDFDCYVEGNMELEKLLPLCERFHDVIYGAFRWCVREDKLRVFKPIPEGEET
jgi:uncharacterized protein (TIGR04255 family)